MHLVGKMELTPRQRQMWKIVADAAPPALTTVERLRQWVLQRKALAASKLPPDELRGRLGALDALLEWTTGASMPDDSCDAQQYEPAGRVAGDLTCHPGGRAELEGELLSLVVLGASDGGRAQSIRERLERRNTRS